MAYRPVFSNNNNSYCRIQNEFGQLEAVIVHRPGREIERLTPQNKPYYLFQDIPFLQQMQKEHDAFCSLLREQNIEVYYLEDLVLEIIKDSKLKRSLVREACIKSGQPSFAQYLLNDFENAEIVETLIGGITASELKEKTGAGLANNNPNKDYFILEPIPNMYLVRDSGSVINNTLISCKAHFPSRIRETTLIRSVFCNHPIFCQNEVIFGKKERVKVEEQANIFTIKLLGNDKVVGEFGDFVITETRYLIEKLDSGKAKERKPRALPEPKLDADYVTVTVASKRTGISPKKLRQFCKDGEIDFIKKGRTYHILWESLLRYLKRGKR